MKHRPNGRTSSRRPRRAEGELRVFPGTSTPPHTRAGAATPRCTDRVPGAQAARKRRLTHPRRSPIGYVGTSASRRAAAPLAELVGSLRMSPRRSAERESASRTETPAITSGWAVASTERRQSRRRASAGSDRAGSRGSRSRQQAGGDRRGPPPASFGFWCWRWSAAPGQKTSDACASQEEGSAASTSRRTQPWGLQGLVAVMRYGTPPPRLRSGRNSVATSTKPAVASIRRIGSGSSRCMNGNSCLV